MNDSHNLLYAQYCCDILPITYAIDLRRMLFLNKLRCHLLSTINVIYDISIHSDYTQLQIDVNSLLSVSLSRWRTLIIV